MDVPLVRVECRLKATSVAAREARQALGPLADHVGEEVFDDVRLLVTELVTNSLRHASLGDGEAIELAAEVRLRTLRVEVRDAGTSFNPPSTPGAREGDDGWGLYLLGRIADRWGINCDPSTCVWFEMDIEKP